MNFQRTVCNKLDIKEYLNTCDAKVVVLLCCSRVADTAQDERKKRAVTNKLLFLCNESMPLLVQ